MKKFLLSAFSLLSLFFSAQTYPSQNISLLGHISPNTATTGVAVDNRRYAGCWGWKQPVTNKEYAIVGGSNGTYFIDISVPTSPSLCAFVNAVSQGCTWREVSSYQNYCYIVSDGCTPNSFQIVDMSSLPASVTVVYDGKDYFERGHTIAIDGDNMYIGAVTYSDNTGSTMNIYSLATPTAPSLLRELKQDYPGITEFHDMHVQNDTVFASCGNQGLYIYKWQPSVTSFTQLGSYVNYPSAGYNHSSYWTADRKHLVFCDEIPVSMPVNLVNVENLSNIQPQSTFNPHPLTTPHNPYIKGSDYAFVSCYQDGLNLYNISSPASPFLAGYFDTHPQGGFNTGNYGSNDYRGNWGAYVHFPSGNIIAADMQNGVFILNASAAYISTGTEDKNIEEANFIFYPNPASDRIAMHYKANHKVSVQIRNILGQILTEAEFSSGINDYFEVKDLANGTYFISLTDGGKTLTKKIIINH